MPKKKRKKLCLPVCCSGAVSPLGDFNAQPTNQPDDLQTREVTEVKLGNSEDQPACPRSPNVSFSGLDVSALDQIAIDSEDQEKDHHLSLPELGGSSSETADEGQDTKLTSASAELDNSETPSRHAQSQLSTGLPPVNEVERMPLDSDLDVSAATAPHPPPAPHPPASRSSESDFTDQDRPASSASDSSSEAKTHKSTGYNLTSGLKERNGQVLPQSL
ncbi:uncharacterized protein LOC124264187 [Haliotis rubra]|uniref:uncharacterized protein LOC124264187 n=1 Tax=Haliotis rubra TaxID=36100 RepID=UPI001EE502AD|nr:uncharacterized protein LOC124264187 [Haliotis rubra]